MKNRLKEIRKDLGLSQKQLGDLIGTTHTQISKLEKSERRLTQEWLYRLADGLECHWSDLMEKPTTIKPEEENLLKKILMLNDGQRKAIESTIDAFALAEDQEKFKGKDD